MVIRKGETANGAVREGHDESASGGVSDVPPVPIIDCVKARAGTKPFDARAGPGSTASRSPHGSRLLVPNDLLAAIQAIWADRDTPRPQALAPSGPTGFPHGKRVSGASGRESTANGLSRKITLDAYS
jgi:hypothetical protein